MLEAVKAFRDEENVSFVITEKDDLPHMHETSKGPQYNSTVHFLSKEELKQVILIVSSSFHIL